MFTGLVESIGALRARTARAQGARVVVALGERAARGPDAWALSLGESIAVNGACLTVDRILSGAFEADLSRETLDKTSLGALPLGAHVHLERATPLGGRLGGHLVLGHVDGLGEVAARTPVGDAVRLAVRAPRDLAPYLASKGSVAIDGVSLTVNQVVDEASAVLLEVMLVPHTLGQTLLGALAPGARVNLEADVMARYVERQLGLRTSGLGGELRGSTRPAAGDADRDAARHGERDGERDGARDDAKGRHDDERLREKLRAGGWG